MRQLLNTLFVTSEDIYLTLDGENVVANREKVVAARYPLHTLSHHHLFLLWGLSRVDGRLCATGDLAFFLFAPWEIPGSGYRRIQWECSASSYPVPDCR